MGDKGKSIAVMQPYIFPYLGYFQLINAVDEFVFYDDVNYIKQGWVNRNRILDKKEAIYFTIPLKKASSFKPINETLINSQLYFKWKKKFIKSIEQGYSKAPYFSDIYKLIVDVFNNSNTISISDLAIISIESISNYLKLNVIFHKSSESLRDTQSQERTTRLLNICKKLNAENYINSIGGKELYDKSDFKKNDIDLYFLKPFLKPYKQFDNDFVSGLSIIDVLMFNSKEEVIEMINQYELL